MAEKGLHAPGRAPVFKFNGQEFSSLEEVKAAMAAAGGLSPAPAASSSTLDRINHVLEDDDKFIEQIQQIFSQYAGHDGVVDQSEAIAMGKMLGHKFHLPHDTFDNIQQMFFRFDYSGDERLDFKETKRLVKFVLKQHKRELEPARPGCGLNGLPRKDLRREFELGKKLGQGGQGAVYLAKCRATNVPRVVKFYQKSGTNECPLEDIKDEFELLKRLDHPNIAKICEVFEDFQNVYVVSEPYTGGDLCTITQKAQENRVPVTHEWLGKIFSQCLAGVVYMHSKETMHCDLKEPNVMITDNDHWSEPHVVLIDFGMAKDFGGERAGGTPGYMPPEFWQMQLWTPKGDMFALAVTWWSIYNGRQGGPFLCQDQPPYRRIMQNTLQQPMDCSGMPPGLRELVMQMSDKNFRRRPTAKEARKNAYFENLSNHRSEIDSGVLKNLQVAARRNSLQNMIAMELVEDANLGQMNELNSMFRAMDKDGDGVVDEEEMKRGLLQIGFKADVTGKLVEALMGDDGKLKYTEFMARMIAAKKDVRSIDLRGIFAELDKDHNGSLSKSELEELLKQKHMDSLLEGRDASDLIKEMDFDGNGVIGFEEFRRAMLGEQVKRQPLFSKGESAQYFSKTYGDWVDCEIVEIDERTASVEINLKQNYWISVDRQKELLRKKAEGALFKEGDEVEYYSTTNGRWMTCSITSVDAGTGEVEISVKPGAKFSVENQRRMIRAKGIASRGMGGYTS